MCQDSDELSILLTFVLGAQMNRLIKMVILIDHNLRFSLGIR